MSQLTRRSILAGTLGLPAMAMTACQASDTRASRTTSSTASEDGASTSAPLSAVSPANVLQVGEDRRIRGVCLGPGPDDFRGDSAWTGLWQRWDWDGRIRSELDDAVRLGANCVRLFGNMHVVTSNVITKSEYLQRWSQFLEYTKSIGLWVYPCGGDLSHWGGFTTLPIAEDIYQSWAELLAAYDHIIGVDITNEAAAQSRVVGGVAYQNSESWLYTVRVLGERVREVSGKPITHSRGLYRYDMASWLYGSPETDYLSDFLDVHCYRSATPHDADALYDADWARGKQLLIGEFGANMTVDSTSRRQSYEGILALITQSRQCVGGLAWTIYDTGTDPASLYGLMDPDRNPRSDIAEAFRSFPTTR